MTQPEQAPKPPIARDIFQLVFLVMTLVGLGAGSLLLWGLGGFCFTMGLLGLGGFLALTVEVKATRQRRR